jgi:hypothetical protein
MLMVSTERGHGRKGKKPAVSPVIATLLLIAIAVASAIVVYAFVTGLIGGLSSGVGSGMITATASLTIPFGSGAALLVVSVTDDSNSPITGIQVTYGGFEDSVALAGGKCLGQTPGGLSCTGVAGSGLTACGASAEVAGPPFKSVPFCNSTPAAIATGTPLPVGREDSAADNVVTSTAAPLVTGTTYAMTITVDFANGGTHTQALSVKAHL